MRNIIEPFVFRVLLNSDVIAQGENKENMDVISKYQILGLVLSAIIIQLLRLLLGKWLWNTYLVKIVSGVKPLENIGQLIIISILLKILIK
uniref:Uncharacterized protein n=1 Tax=viral metagenome TaxID=1070528 RepID=A0A6C0EJ56_9ZZZZ